MRREHRARMSHEYCMNGGGRNSESQLKRVDSWSSYCPVTLSVPMLNLRTPSHRRYPIPYYVRVDSFVCNICASIVLGAR